MKSYLDKILKLPIYVHLLAAILLLWIIGFIVLECIDVYTNHNKAVTVPDVKGMQIEEAAPFFEKNMLRYVIVDSIFSKEVTPGAIVYLTPDAYSKVKKSRIVYITVNAKTEEMALIPDVTDISFRQAYALLVARGFTDIEQKYVTGEYKDLAIGIEYAGRMVNNDTPVPKSAKIILVVSDGNKTPPEEENKPVINEEPAEIIEGDESWF